MYKQLAYEQRFYIELALKENKNFSQIARQLGYSPATISREVRRNRLKSGAYVAKQAQALSAKRENRKPRKIKLTEDLWQQIRIYLHRYWSPEQIVHRLKLPISVRR